MSDKPFHAYTVITSDGEKVNVTAQGYSWDEVFGLGRVLTLKPDSYRGDSQGEFTNPQGIYRTEVAPEWAQPVEEEEDD